jgi:hypothetical protein
MDTKFNKLNQSNGVLYEKVLRKAFRDEAAKLAIPGGGW